MNRYIFIILLISLFFLDSCESPKNGQNNSPSFNKKNITKNQNTLFIESYLRDPRVQNNITSSRKFEIDCKEDTLKVESGIEYSSFRRIYHKCEYQSSDKLSALIKSSTYQTDSTWPFGTNGFGIYLFEIMNKDFPLKDSLQVGSSLKGFEKVFESFQKNGNQYRYEFKDHDYFKSELILEVTKDSVQKITISNSYNYE
jgi:hypothetical protein